MDFTGKVGLVTGGGSGIGRATSALFAERGGAVLVADLNEAGAKATVETILRKGGRAEACRVDVELPSEFHHGEDVVILPAGRMRQDQIQPGACAQDGFHGLPIRPVVVWKGDPEIDDQRGPALLQRGQYFAARIQLVAVVHREHPRRLEPMLPQAAHHRIR